MVALKQLVVGVHQNLEFLVHEAFAQLHGNGLVRHGLFVLFLTVVEDVVQTLQLGGLPADHNIDVAVLVVGPEVPGDQVKLLVEGRLGNHPIFQDESVGPSGPSSKLHHAKRLEQGFEMLAVEKQFFRWGPLDFSTQPVVMRLCPLHGLVQSGSTSLGVGHPKHSVLGQEPKERLVGLMQACVAHVGHNGGAGHLGDTEL